MYLASAMAVGTSFGRADFEIDVADLGDDVPLV
jgi:hypothetical protein